MYFFELQVLSPIHPPFMNITKTHRSDPPSPLEGIVSLPIPSPAFASFEAQTWVLFFVGHLGVKKNTQPK